jgi:hypothetical protein
MKILEFLMSAAGGGIVGPIISIATKAFGVWEAKKKAEVDIMMMQAQTQAMEKTAAWAAFQESQKGANATLSVLPASTSPWVANTFVLMDAFKSFTRPALTWLSVIFIFIAYFKAQPSQQESMIPELIFMGSTAFFWWFGERIQRKGVK